VIGSGAWGTALSIVLARGGRHEVRLWAYEREVRESIESARINDLFLPGSKIPEAVEVSNALSDTLRRAEIVLTAMPSHHARRLYGEMKGSVPAGVMVVSATKGIEKGTYKRMTEVAADAGGMNRIAALSGPTFAKEVARGDPTALTVASEDANVSATVQREFSDPMFRIYTNDD